jgi:hypothetical protein
MSSKKVLIASIQIKRHYPEVLPTLEATVASQQEEKIEMEAWY